ncbi:MAG: hypothetical protein HUK18_04150 [Bacteroidales bacterium]|nr:hypothetical protein [Bacteroidales bacterium]
MDKYIRILRLGWLLAMVLAMVPVLVSVVIILSDNQVNANSFNMQSKQIYIAFFVLVALALLLHIRKKKMLKNAIKASSLVGKLQKYRTYYNFSLYGYAFISVLMTILFYCFTPSWEYSIIQVLFLLLIVISRPYELKVKLDLQLSDKEQEDLKYLKVERKSNYEF